MSLERLKKLPVEIVSRVNEVFRKAGLPVPYLLFRTCQHRFKEGPHNLLPSQRQSTEHRKGWTVYLQFKDARLDLEQPPSHHRLRGRPREHFANAGRRSFRGVQEEVVLLLASGQGGGPGRLRLAEVESGEDLTEVETILAGAEAFAPGVEPVKWIPGYAANPGKATLDHLQELELLHPLEDVGKASIGFVSGANEYFVLTAREAGYWGLPEPSLRPALARARQIPGLQISAEDFAQVRSQGERCLLWLPGETLTRAEKRYVQAGEERGFAMRYKCRVRSPWFRVPGVITPEAFLTYMSDLVPRLCLNRAGVVSSNTLHTVRLPKVPAALRKPFVAAFYNSATLLSCERVGRSYGGGVLKLEPREADRILVPSVGAGDPAQEPARQGRRAGRQSPPARP